MTAVRSTTMHRIFLATALAIACGCGEKPARQADEGTAAPAAATPGGAADASPTRSFVEAVADPAESARSLLAAAGVRGGLVVHLGCGGGELTVALHASESYVVHGLERDAGKVETARERIRSAGLCGEVTVEPHAGRHLPYIDNLVNLVVCEGASWSPRSEVIRVLRPGGVACLRDGDGWELVRKPLDDRIDEWTHFLHDADGNAVANDSVVDTPMHAQWVAGPRFTKTHSVLSTVNAMVSARGRLFYIVDEGPIGLAGMLPSRWNLVARDAFNGVVLWRRPLTAWQPYNNPQRRMFPVDLHRRLVAVGDRAYATLSVFGPTVCLDAATGKTLRTYAGTELTQEIVHSDGNLYIVLGKTPPGKVDRRQLADRIVAVEPALGERRRGHLGPPCDVPRGKGRPGGAAEREGGHLPRRRQRQGTLEAQEREPLPAARVERPDPGRHQGRRPAGRQAGARGGRGPPRRAR
jgi:SAM-dependent methyltransferase